MRWLHRGRWAAGGLAALFFCGALAQSIEERIQACGSCHGADGISVTAGIPSIAAQPRVFLENQLVLIREGLRGSEEMQRLVRGLSDREIMGIAQRFSRLPARPWPGQLDPVLARSGQAAAARLRCASCHANDFRGYEQMPRLAGQREDYLLESMRMFRDNPRRGGDTIMTAALYGVGDAEIRAMAHFLARLGSE